EVIPKLKGKDIGHIDITYHNLKHSKKIKWQQLASSTRWLQELYPIDGEFTKKLGIADSLIQFHTTYQESPIYKISVSNSKWEAIFTDEFNPKYIVLPFFKQFPKYDSIRVETGWFKAKLNNKMLADEAIDTDLIRFWRHYQ